MMEENSNTNNSNQNSAMDTSGGAASISATTSSNNSSNSNSTSINAPSPHTNASASDQTNLPTTIQQSADRGDDILKDLKTENPGSVKNEDNEKSDKSNSSNTGCSPLESVKEEMDLMHTLVNVKKEENSVSPAMSPVGFGSIGNLTGHSNSDSVGGRAVTPGKEAATAGNNGNKNQKKSNVLTTSGGCVEHIGADLINSASNEACSGVAGNGGGGGAKPPPSSNFNSEAVVNCSDYTQQQNHIFVFSTQLANKGAESVINGQFPNIIAYHCTQPATKSFLDDLFIKNPTKMSKLQRQNSLNIVNGPHWPGGNNKPKLSSGGGKPSLSKSCHELTNENEALMSWDNASHNLEGATNEALKMLDSLESGGMPGQSGKASAVGSLEANLDGSKPSLQGVKVPDENLTPQQRQHREEQLAKLKKMTQFLFPENDSGGSQLEQMAAGAANLASLMANKSPTDIACLPGMPSPAGMGMNSLPNPNAAPPQGPAGPPGGQAMRLGQGPPPPYNSKQRSASVPIATQSPNPASPHNPLSNLSLPSPNMDVNAPIMSTATTPTTSTSSGNTPTAHTANTKNPYPQEASPTTNSSCGNNNRNRGNLHQYNSNPSTPLSHMSPKDLETFNSTGQPTGDAKNARPPGPQRCSSAEIPNIEGLFPPNSPGLNFPSHMTNNPNSGVNTFKPTGGPTGLERQNSAPHFGRRPDNVPLNPNSNRMPPNKLSHAFDPISSLAQMSQQLATGNDMSGMGVITSNDINPNMESLMNSLDAAAMDHCMSGGGKPGNMPGGVMPGNMPGGMPPHMSNPAAFMSNNCHMPGQMPGQRLMNPRMGGMGGGGFIPSTGVGMMREGPGNFPGGMPPSHRMPMGGMGGRMPANFGNIQVKASTPNTIQYMPVRPQNNNNNGNNNGGMRVPPSLDFLQRFANPKPSNSPNAMVGNPDVGQMNPNGPNDPNKMPNSPNMIGGGGGGSAEMNFFQNYNQMNAMPEGMPGGLLSANEQQNAMMRGMRPMMRQQHMGHGGPNPGNPGNRMQGPGGNLGPQDSMSGASMFGVGGGGPMGPGGHQMFPGGPPSQKPMKGMPTSGPCQNMNAVNSNVNNMGQVPGMGGGPMPLGGPGGLMGPNSNMPNGPQPPCGSGNGNYNSFPGNPSSDLKYAQQYHSFQQQLYATSTRSQQGGNNANMANNMNPAYFHNK